MPPHRGRARPAQNGKLARSGIRTRGGAYRKFDSQRVKEVEPESSDHESLPGLEITDEEDDISDEDLQATRSYSRLLASLQAEDVNTDRPQKRRKLSHSEPEIDSNETQEEPHSELEDNEQEDEDDLSGAAIDDETEVDDTSDPYETHLVIDDEAVSILVEETAHKRTPTTKRISKITVSESIPDHMRTVVDKGSRNIDSLYLKPRLVDRARSLIAKLELQEGSVLPYLFNYVDVLYGIRTPANALRLRQATCLHAVNHILKGRDKIMKNNTRLTQAGPDIQLEFRDQGFTRPKVLILTETRQMSAKYAEAIVDAFGAEQEENARRFKDAFTAPIEQRDMPEDFNELFEGNNDNNFVTTIKFARKTLKYYSAFYQSDIILASPLGIQRIIENDDKRKQDHDFLSSVELVVVDQTDAMQMQNFDNVEMVFKHLNLQPKELRDCDVNRVRNWYLEGKASYFRQTIMLSAYITPEMNKLYNTTLKNTAGKVKLSTQYQGAIRAATGLGIKQSFHRFTTQSPADDPDARFKFFTTSILPLLLRLPRPSSGGQGTLIFISSYFDFLRIRNFFATSTTTENVSFGAISDYTDVSDQRRARAHFLSGRHSILLYTQRAHHFFRLRLRGIRNVVMYGVPDNEVFYKEIVADFLSASIEQGIVGVGECTSRSIFSKFDALKMERIVGSDRVHNMLAGSGDTFDFI